MAAQSLRRALRAKLLLEESLTLLQIIHAQITSLAARQAVALTTI
jgi:hypothetical protein